MLSKERVNEINNLIEWLLGKNKQYSRTQIVFTDYCKEKMLDRRIEEETVISILISGNYPYYAEKQEGSFRGKAEERYKLIYKISSRYSFIIVLTYGKILKVVNVIKTSKGAEKLWRKKISK